MTTCLYQLETNRTEKLKRFSSAMSWLMLMFGLGTIIENVITRRSADELKLKKGDTVSAVVKATEVMIQKD
jgi:molybdopterin-binding protein